MAALTAASTAAALRAEAWTAVSIAGLNAAMFVTSIGTTRVLLALAGS
jgi:hypothetical protein